MSEAGQLADLTNKIYDAALDRPLWQGVLKIISSFIPATSVMLFSLDAHQRDANFHFVHGISPQDIRSYNECYIKLNPTFPAMLLFEVGVVIGQSEIEKSSEFNRPRFFEEGLEPQGWSDAMAVALEKSATSCAVLTVGRHGPEGMIDEGARRRMCLIVPHLRRAAPSGTTAPT